MISVYIIDDHQVVIEGMELLLSESENIKCIGSSLSAEDGIKQLEEIKPNILLLDINLPGMNGVEACKIINEKFPEVKIIALSMLKEGSLIKMMLKNGAYGYVLKSAGKDELIESIEQISAGKKYLSNEVTSIIIDNISGKKKISQKNPFPALSRREKEVLNLIIDELTTKEIADKLFISFGTVETHRRNMLIKLGVRNTAGLVRTALEYDLLK